MTDWTRQRARFDFIAQALNGSGVFRPQVGVRATWVTDATTGALTRGPDEAYVTGDSALVRYPRESDAKYAARNRLATYQNHLRSASERFVSFLSRRRPLRDAASASPFADLLMADADLRGNTLDTFWRQFALQARARGTMLLVLDTVDLPPDASLQDQQRLRAVPYLRMAYPEDVVSYELDDRTGLFASVTLAALERVEGKLKPVERDYTTTGWRIRDGQTIIAAGEHAFGQCQVLAFCEAGEVFPAFGKYAQIADLSCRLFNARSELDEILRGQTFSVLTLQVPLEAMSTFNAARDTASIGTHSMLAHQGVTPAFIAPDAGPAQTYGNVITELQSAISNIAMEESTADASGAAESGVARRLRFEALNADLAVFAGGLQQLENRLWAMFHRALGVDNRMQIEWPTDFNLVDTATELDILVAMQAAGFPEPVLAAKRVSIVGAEFDAADETLKAELLTAVQEAAQEQQPGQA